MGRWRQRRWWAVGAAATGLAAVVVVWFQPQKLLIDDRVSEPEPVALVSPAPSVQPSAPSVRPHASPPHASTNVVLASGAFRSGEHSTRGHAVLLRLPDGRRFLRLADLRTSNGAKVVVWLSGAAAGASDGAVRQASHLDLGGLKGNIGSQNYAVPDDAALASYRSVVIWCARFHVAFGSAALG